MINTLFLFDQQGSPCCHNFLAVTQSYYSKVTPIGALHAEKIAQTVLLFILRIAFPASLFHKLSPFHQIHCHCFVLPAPRSPDGIGETVLPVADDDGHLVRPPVGHLVGPPVGHLVTPPRALPALARVLPAPADRTPETLH